MSPLSFQRSSRTALRLAVLAAFAMTPTAAQAATTEAGGTLTAGALSNTAPAITPFSTALTGTTQLVTTAVGAYSVTDATGSNEGYNLTVAASDPVVDGSAAGAGTGASLTLTPTTATAAAGNPAATGPVAAEPQLLSTTAATIQSAEATTGQGRWEVAADTGGTESLAIVIPGDASAGDYSSTLTYTTATLVS